jgi:copper oxidase (laccase) domain-containing protein
VLKALPNAEQKSVFTNKQNGKYMLDLKEINRQILIKAGIISSNIELSQLCTSCHQDLFFSHRRDHGKSGRMMAWIGLKSE